MIATRLTASAFAICFGIASFAAAGPVLRGHTDKDQYAPSQRSFPVVVVVVLDLLDV